LREGIAIGAADIRGIVGMRGKRHLDFEFVVADGTPDEITNAVGIDALFERFHDAFGEGGGVVVDRPGAFGLLDLVDETDAANHVDAGLEVGDIAEASAAEHGLGRDNADDRHDQDDQDQHHAAGKLGWHFSTLSGSQN